MKKGKNILIAAGVFLITFVLIYFQAFYSWDKITADRLCQTAGVPDKNIYILAIDDKTLGELGALSDWSREVAEDLVNLLNQDEKTAPAVIGFDVLYLEKTDEKTDRAFAEACAKMDNVVTAMNIQFKEMPETDENGKIVYNPFYIEEADYPYEELKNSAAYGFANTIVDNDGYVRRSMSQISSGEENLQSLSVKIYQKYMETLGAEAVLPKTDENGQFFFQYTCRSGGYSTISLIDVLNGTVNPAVFQNAIVLVGAYAVGMQDSYVPAISHGQQMYGVEIHANIINALLEGKTQQEVPRFPIALIAGILAAVCGIISRKLKLFPSALFCAAVAVIYVVAAKLLYGNGYILPVLVFPTVIVILYVYAIIEQYIAEILRRKKIVGVFKQYVAPQIVEEISKQKEFKVTLGGEKRHIAVLFVDIRGFTTMSESLQPEEVVEILNEYLALTTESIFKNSGTLDKFVGDATMAVFNAPFDLDDYVFRAVKTAWDMKAGSDAIAEKFEERFGKSVAFGIGVNCGDAVVGNIGCEFRMDYTAIGDTVNTAARLESNAKRGQILISAEVYETVKDRVEVTPIGEIPLKGKSKGVFVYQVDEVKA